MGPRCSRAHYTLSPSRPTPRYPSSRVKLGTSPPATFSLGPPASLRFFPPVVFPPRGGTPSRSLTTVGISPIRKSLPLKARSFVIRPALSCSMALWLPTTGFQKSSVHGMPGHPYYTCLLLRSFYCEGRGTPCVLSSLPALPLTVKVYRSVSYLPPSYVGRMGSSTHLASPEPRLPSFLDQTPHHVCLALHTSTGFSPLQQAVYTSVHRVSLVLLHTCDHVSWSSRLCCDVLAKTHARPKSQAVLLMGLLRALWEYQGSYDDTPLIIHIPESALVTSLRSPPTSFASEVTAWLNETVQLFLSPLASLRHSPRSRFSSPIPSRRNLVCTRPPASLLSLRLHRLQRPPSRSTPWVNVSRWALSETLGLGGTSSRGTPCSSPWNSACNPFGVFKPSANVTWTEPHVVTLQSGKTSRCTLRPKFSTCPTSLKAPGATMSGTGSSVTTRAKKPPQLRNAGHY